MFLNRRFKVLAANSAAPLAPLTLAFISLTWCIEDSGYNSDTNPLWNNSHSSQIGPEQITGNPSSCFSRHCFKIIIL